MNEVTRVLTGIERGDQGLLSGEESRFLHQGSKVRANTEMAFVSSVAT
jgi:hypothetical protein